MKKIMIKLVVVAHRYQEMFEKDQVKPLFCHPNAFFSPKKFSSQLSCRPRAQSSIST